MTRLSLGPKTSDVFVAVYLAATLAMRFLLEAQLKGHYLISLALGAFCLLFLWALIRSQVLQPTFFGFFPRKT